jgi:precorrin-6B methylase 2
LGNPEHSEAFKAKEDNWLFNEFMENVRKVEVKNYSVITTPSPEAADLFNNDFLDFIFIDGRHDGEYPLFDMRA